MNSIYSPPKPTYLLKDLSSNSTYLPEYLPTLYNITNNTAFISDFHSSLTYSATTSSTDFSSIISDFHSSLTYSATTSSTDFSSIISDYYSYSYRFPTYFHVSPNVSVPDVSVVLRDMIRSRISPSIRRNRRVMPIVRDIREIRARQTLRRIIGDRAYRRFLRDGFITITSKRGLTYRIYPGYGITEVYDRGMMVDRLCVILRGEFPPTDSLIMRYLLILNNEDEFRQYAIKHDVINRLNSDQIDESFTDETLLDLWNKLKRSRAA